MAEPTPVTLVILGASGDLTQRLLLPGLATLLRNGDVSYDIRLVGAAHEEMDGDEWADRVRQAMADGGCPHHRSAGIVEHTRYVQLDVTDPDAVASFLDDVDEAGRPVVLYFALPPQITQKAIEVLSALDVPDDLRLAIEKPFGTSFETARHLNGLLEQVVPESQIFRVDHFLGKATVLNLLGLRFGNRIFEPGWNTTNIERVEIIADETLALEGRAGYYDTNGAMKDMIQSHLLLVMAMFAMEEPARMDELELRDLIAHVLRATHLWDDDPLSSRRARYTAGTIQGREIPDYTAEDGVDASRQTETLAEVTVEIRNSRWAGVPFRLRSGKALGDDFRGIIVKYRPVAYLPSGFTNEPAPNVLVIGLTPETLTLAISTNAEGNRWDFERTALSAELSESPVRPYGEILDGILAGDPLLAVRGDATEEMWRILTPVFDAWESGEVPLEEYRAGSTGPLTWH